MSENPPPTFFFTGINYNSQFYNSSSLSVTQSQLTNYLLRIGSPVSIASNTTFSGTLTTNGIINSTGNITTTTPSTSDNSTKVSTTAYVQNQGFTTLSAVQANNNNFSGITTFLSNIVANSLIITPTQLSFLNNVSSGKIGQSQILNGYVDLSSSQSSIGGTKTFISTCTFSNTIQGNITAVYLNLFSGLYTTYYFLFSPFNTAGGSSVYGISGSTFNYSTTTNTLKVANILSNLGSSTATTQTTSDNSTFISTTAFVKNQGYTTLATVQSNTNIFTANQTFQGGIDGSTTQTVNFGSNAPIMSGSNISAGSIQTGDSGIASAITNLLMIPSRANYTMGGDSQTHINLISGGVGNSSIGDRSLQQCTTGANNSAISTQALGSLTTGSNNCGIGTSALINYNGSASVGIGYNAGIALLSGDGNCIFGQYSGLNYSVGSSNVIIGDNAAGGSITSGNNNCFIGSSTSASVASVSNSSCLGSGSQITGSNQIVLGTSSETVYIPGNLNLTGTFTGTISNIKTTSDNTNGTYYIPFSKTTAQTSTQLFLDDVTGPLSYNPSTSTITALQFSGNATTSTNATNIISGTTNIQQQSQYVHSSFTLTTAATLTISAPFYEIYPLAPTANLVITLPTASASYIGVRLQFRRTGGTTTVTITSASSNIYPNNSLTLTNSIMASSVYTAVIYCSYLAATTYAWYLA